MNETTTAASPSTSASSPRGSVRRAVGMLVVVEMVSGLIQGMTPSLIPQIGKQFGIVAADLNWIAAIQLLAASIAVPIVSRLGDLYGHRRLMRCSLASVLVGAALFAYGPSFPVMLLGQVFLGPVAALLPLQLAIVRSRLDSTRARSAIGFLVAAALIGGTAGFEVGGLVQASTNDVRATLTVPVLLAALALAIVFFFVPDSVIRARGSVDWAGALAISVGLGSLLWVLGGASGRPVGVTLALLAGSLAVLAVWVVIELKSDHPLIDVRALVRPQLLRWYLAAITLGLALVGSQTVGLTYLSADPAKIGYGLKLPPLVLAQVLVVAGLAGGIGALLMSRVSRAIGGTRTAIAGVFIDVVVQIIFIVQHDSAVLFVVLTPLGTLGTSLAFAALPAMIAEHSRPDEIAMATGMYNTTRAIGGSLGGAVFAFVLSSITLPGTRIASERAYVVAWTICAVAGVTAIGFIALVGRSSRRESAGHP
ncbi:MFS transporter [Amycolatopsis rhabdoformis]|uniref:MFS transporter n=1 Tax=Amycolatopsis rhabdoformis TaxID=1448059 RepID=A0ABZ1I7K6_9PSEU|nr:MFS transporter [Amycolatopsis rhabdoformis]WSE29961.1 MFS transporter [Amycolatopsis rhabdoformis]